MEPSELSRLSILLGESRKVLLDDECVGESLEAKWRSRGSPAVAEEPAPPIIWSW